MTNRALLIDYKFCNGCNTCVLACRNEKELEEGQWGIKVYEEGPVNIDGKWMWNYVPVPSDRCDLCADRIESGEMPSCVQHCLGACMEVVPLEGVGKRMAELGRTVVCFVP